MLLIDVPRWDLSVKPEKSSLLHRCHKNGKCSEYLLTLWYCSLVRLVVYLKYIEDSHHGFPESSDSRWIMVRKLVLSLTRLSFPAQPVFSELTRPHDADTVSVFTGRRIKPLSKGYWKNWENEKIGTTWKLFNSKLWFVSLLPVLVNVSSVECFSLHFHKTELVSALPRGEGWKELTFRSSRPSSAFQLWHISNGVKLLIKLQTAYFCSGIRSEATSTLIDGFH